MTARQTPELPTDAALVAAYRNGDQRAATELVGRHAGPVGRFLYASGASSSDVDDLVQDTFFRAFRRARRLAGRGVIPELALHHRRQPPA